MEQDQKDMSHEEILAHIEKANLDQYDKADFDAGGAQQDLASKMKQICAIYKGIRPVLSVIVNFPLIPSSIKNAIKKFMALMNSLCP